MIDLYGKSHVFVQFGQAGQPMRTAKAELRATLKGKDGDSIWRVKVPGFGWRKLHYSFPRGFPYVILTGTERATITV